MKQIDWVFNGGLPLSQNILEWQRDGLRDAINSLLYKGYHGQPVVITGCVYDPVTHDVTAGWIYDGTEACFFPGGNTTTAGTDKIKAVTTTATVVYENGAAQAVYRNRHYAFDATGTLSVIPGINGLHRWGVTPYNGSEVVVAKTEVTGSLFFRLNSAAGTMHITGQLVVSNADAFSIDCLGVEILSDETLEADPVFGPHYPDELSFLGMVDGNGSAGGSGGFADVHGVPITSIGFRLSNTGLHATLRKVDTGVPDYAIYIDTVVFLTR